MVPEEIWSRGPFTAQVTGEEVGNQFDIVSSSLKKQVPPDQLEIVIERIGLEDGLLGFNGVMPLPTKTALILFAFADDVETVAGCEGWGDETEL